jgi:RHS repeat-associated protein
VTATNVAGSTAASSAASPVVSGYPPPQNTSVPAVAGYIDVGHTLTTNEGLWSSGLTYTTNVQWQRCDAGGTNCGDIVGADGDSYVVVPTDLTGRVRVKVTSTNGAGATIVYSSFASQGDYVSAVTASHPVAWWRLDEVSGATAADYTGDHNGAYPTFFNGYDGEGAPYGTSDAGITTDNGHGPVSIPYSAALNQPQFSVEAWVRPTAFGDGSSPGTSESPIVDGASCNGYHLSIATPWHHSPYFVFGVPATGSGVVVSAPELVEADKWYLVTATFDGTTARLYVNGEAVAAGSVAGTYTPNATTSTTIGRCTDLNSEMRAFGGNIDEVSVYNHAMSAAEVSTHASYVALKNEQTWGDGELAADASAEWPGGVNAATGNEYISDNDAEMPGIGLPFTFTRNYNSADSATGPFGVGWTFSYGAKLTIQSDGDVIARGGDGQQLHFAHEQDGSFLPDNGGRSILTVLTGGDYELVTTDQTQYVYSSAGRLTSLKDRNGQGLTFTYDAFSNLSNIHDSGGRDISVGSDTSGHITSVTLPDNRKVSYAYTNGLLTSVTDLRGGVTSYTYDASGRLQTIVDPNNHTAVSTTYGSDGRVVSQTDALNHTRTYGWNPATQTSTFTDERNHTSTEVFSDNVLISSTDPLGHASTYAYGSDLNGRSTTDERGNVTRMTSDANGNMLSRTFPDGSQETWTYDGKNDVLTHTNARGYATTYAYDASGNLTSEVAPGGAETDYGRDPSGTGLLVSQTDARGKVTNFAYDTSGNRLSTSSPLGEATTMTYDSTGRLLSVVDPRGTVTGADPNAYRTTYVYDDADHVLSQTDPLGHTTTWTYDPVGNRTSTTDARSDTTAWSYDAANELSTVTAPDGSTTTYAYDAGGSRTTRTDSNTHTTSYGYDELNRLTSTVTPLAETWTYGYDAAGNRASVAAPGGGTTSYAYDSQNRLTTIDYSDSTPDVSFTYDADGNRSTMQDGRGSTSYAYDNRDRVTSITEGSGPFGYSYDNVGDVTERQYPDGTTVDYTYDDDGRLSNVTSGSATSTYGYDAASDQISLTLPLANGYVETRSYDNAGRVTEVKNASAASTLSQFDYAYDAVGNATQITTVAGVENYAYDDEGRVTDVCYQSTACGPSDPHIAYTYDQVGNRLTEADASKTDTYSYNADDELASVSDGTTSTTYGYDARGNQTAAGTASYGFNLAEQMTSATIDGTTTTYAYDGDGNRAQAAGTSTTNYAWDTNNEMAQLATESDGTGATLRSYVYGADTLAMNAGGSSYYFQHDRLGSVVDVTSTTGAAEWVYSYDPFGNPRTTTKVDPSAPTNPLGYVGQLSDAATGLYDMRARVYDRGTGRFLSTDPLAADPTDPAIELYDYAGQDPVDAIDVTGTVCWRCVGRKFGEGAAVAAPTLAGFTVGGLVGAVTLNPAAGIAAGAFAAGFTSYAVSKYANHQTTRNAVKHAAVDAGLSATADLIGGAIEAAAPRSAAAAHAASLVARRRTAAVASAAVIRFSQPALRVRAR